MSKTVCIYHANCFDGICAAWVVSKAYPNTEFRAFSYNMEFPWNEYGKNDDIIIVDFSFKRDIMLAIAEQCGSILVLDHHKTAQANCEGLDFCIFDMNESGASLAWKYFFPNKDIPLLVRYIKDRDLWLFKEEYSEEINAYIQSFPMNILIYNELDYQFHLHGWQPAYEGGQSINRYKQTMVKAICKNAAFKYDYPFYDNRIPVVNATLLFSEVGHELCKMYSNAPFAVYYFDSLKDGVRQWGLRSIGDFDVSDIAKRFGGGGHKNAAGFEQKLNEI